MINPTLAGKIPALAACVVLLAGCGAGSLPASKVSEPFKDAPRSDHTNESPADVIEMPDGFSNVATKCDHGNRVYVAYHGDRTYASLAVVGGDPTCRGR